MNLIRESLGLSQTPGDHHEICPPRVLAPFAVATDMQAAHNSLHLSKCILLTISPDIQGRNYRAARADRRNRSGPEKVAFSVQATQPGRGRAGIRPPIFSASVLLPYGACPVTEEPPT